MLVRSCLEFVCLVIFTICLFSESSAHNLFVKHHNIVFLLDNVTSIDNAHNLFVRSLKFIKLKLEG